MLETGFWLRPVRGPTTGYEKLLYDCMVGDASLFHRSDMVEAAWEAAAPFLEAWKNHPPTDFPNYAAGTWDRKQPCN
jgi:glucose-6-phosphate 1-dehydrogenase